MNQLRIYYHDRIMPGLIPIKCIPQLLRDNPDKVHVVFNSAIQSYRFVDFSFRTVRDFKKQYVKLRSVGFEIQDIIIIQYTSFIHFDRVVECIYSEELQPVPKPLRSESRIDV